MDPIGASSTWRWLGYSNSYVNVDGLQVQSVSGGGHFGGGIFINSLDHARFGLLFLRQGQWNNQAIDFETMGTRCSRILLKLIQIMAIYGGTTVRKAGKA